MGLLHPRAALAVLLCVAALNVHAQRGMDRININGEFVTAVRAGQVQRARDLLAAGAQVDSRDRNGDSALNLAAARGNTEMADMLLAARPDVNLANLAGVTPLMAASYAARPEMVRKFLAAGARIEPIDRMKKNAAIYAAAQGCVDCLAELLKAGTAVNARFDADLTLLMWAAGGGHEAAARLLVEQGADRSLRDDRGKTAAEIAREANHSALAGWLQP